MSSKNKYKLKITRIANSRKQEKIKIKKDKKFLKFINSRFLYISLLILLLAYIYTDNVINYPLYIKVISYIIALIFVVGVFVWRYKKYYCCPVNIFRT